MKRTVLFAALAVVALVWASPSVAVARDEKTQPDPETPRIYVVMIRSEPQKMYVLEKTKVQKVGDVPFLTGKLIGTVGGNDWRVGSTMWLPVLEITQMNDYATLAELQKLVIINK